MDSSPLSTRPPFTRQIEPATADRICASCTAPDPTKDARIVWLEGDKRPRIQHRRHCVHYDPALATLVRATLSPSTPTPQPGTDP